MSACSGNSIAFRSESGDGSFYIPPTALIVAGQQIRPTAITTPTATRQATHPPATPTPSCSYNLQFIEDITIPDGSIVLPGLKLDKRWRVENTGTCNWDESFRLRLISGQDFGASSEQALFPARSGTEATIRIIFNAPREEGVYHSAWQAVNPRGDLFGDPIYIDFVVQAQDTSS